MFYFLNSRVFAEAWFFPSEESTVTSKFVYFLLVVVERHRYCLNLINILRQHSSGQGHWRNLCLYVGFHNRNLLTACWSRQGRTRLKQEKKLEIVKVIEGVGAAAQANLRDWSYNCGCVPFSLLTNSQLSFLAYKNLLRQNRSHGSCDHSLCSKNAAIMVLTWHYQSYVLTIPITRAQNLDLSGNVFFMVLICRSLPSPHCRQSKSRSRVSPAATRDNRDLAGFSFH